MSSAVDQPETIPISTAGDRPETIPMSTAGDQPETISSTKNAETASTEAPAMPERRAEEKEPKVPVFHTLMIKSIVDNDDVNEELALIATFVQTVFHPKGLKKKEEDEEGTEEDIFFAYRFNEKTAKDEEIEVRRSVTDAKNIYTRTTFQARIPMEVESFLHLFPFEICTATVAIELSSKDFEYNGKTHRPDLVLSQIDRRNNISIQNLDAVVRDPMIGKECLFFEREPKQKQQNKVLENDYETILTKIDKTANFSFLSPHPKVFYRYEVGKDYCPRFVITFLVAPEGFARFVQFVLPLLLVAVTATLNAVNDFGIGVEDVDVSSHLQVTSALTLTIVFLLPEIISKGNRTSFVSAGNMTVIVFFVGMLLSSLPRGSFEPTSQYSAIPQLVGIAMMLASLVIPFLNAFRFWKLCRNLKRIAVKEKDEGLFLADAKSKSNFHKPKTAEDKDLRTVGKLLEDCEKERDHKLYESTYEGEKPKYKRLHWRALKLERKTNVASEFESA